MGAEEARNEGADEVDGAMSGVVLVQHGHELFVDVRAYALLHFRDVLVGARKFLRLFVVDVGTMRAGRRIVYCDAMRRWQEHVEAGEEVRMAVEHWFHALHHAVGGDVLLLKLLHNTEEAVVDERAVGEDDAHPLQKCHGVIVSHSCSGCCCFCGHCCFCGCC